MFSDAKREIMCFSKDQKRAKLESSSSVSSIHLSNGHCTIAYWVLGRQRLLKLYFLLPGTGNAFTGSLTGMSESRNQTLVLIPTLPSQPPPRPVLPISENSNVVFLIAHTPIAHTPSLRDHSVSSLGLTSSTSAKSKFHLFYLQNRSQI